MAWFHVTCPFCQKRIPLSSVRCPACRALLPHETGEAERRRILAAAAFVGITISILATAGLFYVIWV